MRRLVLVLGLTFITAAPAFAQRASAPPAPPSTNPQGIAIPAPAPRPTTPIPPGPPQNPPVEPIGPATTLPVNMFERPLPKSWKTVRLEIVLTDSASGLGQKTLTLLLVDGRRGSIRAVNGRQIINADAVVTLPDARMHSELARRNLAPDPQYGEEGKLLLDLTLQYRPELPNASAGLSIIDETISVVVSDGAKMAISQAVDPGSDRKVTLEVTATTVK